MGTRCEAPYQLLSSMGVQVDRNASLVAIAGQKGRAQSVPCRRAPTASVVSSPGVTQL
jgi:hypothetical protein